MRIDTARAAAGRYPGRRRPGSGRRGILLVVGLVVVIGGVGAAVEAGPAPSGGHPDQLTEVQIIDLIGGAPDGSALAAVGDLAIKGRAPKTGYNRARFGQRWKDVDRNGCDTRNDILRRDLTAIVVKAGTQGCKVLGGSLADPYTGTLMTFVQGTDTSDQVQIDHVVALSDAWQKGAQGWDASTRSAFANDPLNLLAVDGATNTAKGDGDAATWLPPNRTYRCAYVARQVAVKVEYQAWVTPAERAAIVVVLADCPTEPLLVAGAGVAPVVTTTAAAETVPSSVDITGGAADGCDVKGNISTNSGEKIYHVPGGENYEATVITESRGERWFCSAAEAEAAGWRAAQR
ncbi:MAG: HNH endonuclease family protein [Nakamurella sp.]